MVDMEYLEKLLLLEDAENYFEKLKEEGIFYWHYIRYYVSQLIQESCFGIKSSTTDILEYKKYKKGIIEKIRSLELYKQKDILVFAQGRRIKDGKYYRDPYNDAWLSKCCKSYYALEFDYLGQHFTPVPTNNLKYLDYSVLDSYIEFHRKKINIPNIRKPVLEILEDIESEYNIKLKPKQKRMIIEKAVYSVYAHKGVSVFYSNLLKKVKPKIITTDGAYTYDRMVLCEVAKKYDIPVVEFQHAVHVGHIAYNFKKKRKLVSFPDYMLVFGKFDKDTNRLPINNNNIYPVGSAELDYQLSKLKYLNKKKKKIITVISSDDTDMLKIVLRLSGKLDLDKYKIIVKLHPSEYDIWEKRYYFLKNHKSISVVTDSKHNIYYYLIIADYIIGSDSTAVVEASVTNARIFITKTGLYQKQLSLVENKRAVLVESENEILDYISNQNCPIYNQNYYFCNNACKRVNKALNEIISKY